MAPPKHTDSFAGIDRVNVPDHGHPDVTVVFVNYNTANLLERMLASLDAAGGNFNVQTIVVDNASRDDSVALLKKRYPDVQLVENTVNVGFGRANNQAMPFVRGRYVLLLNTDAFVSQDTLDKTIGYMEAHPRCGILGVRLVGEDGSLQPSCRYFPTPWNIFLLVTGLSRVFPKVHLIDDFSWDHASIRNCDWVPGCFYLVRKTVIDRVGLFDPRYFLYYEEVDHCRAARRDGWEVTYYPFTEVVHIGGESAKSLGSLTSASRQLSAIQIESELLYFRKNHGLSGLLSMVILATCSDTFTIFKGVFRRTDRTRANMAWQHLRTVFRSLVVTRMGTRPTR
jgi:N-acetylglucosaminyl-diphospho-decaprenol L-rhamnosyltransferase